MTKNPKNPKNDKKIQKIQKIQAKKSDAKNDTKKSLCREEYSFAANSLRYETISYFGDLCANTRANYPQTRESLYVEGPKRPFAVFRLVPCQTRPWSEVATGSVARQCTPRSHGTCLFRLYTWLCGVLVAPKIVKLFLPQQC